MTLKEAYKILDLPPGTELQEIKKRYRQLMMLVHPDANTSPQKNYPYSAEEINHAFSLLKKEAFADRETSSKEDIFHSQKSAASKRKRQVTWDAPVNVHAYMEREVLHYVEDYDGTVLGNFCIAKGKYLWTTEEDFPLFLLSLYQCGKQLLDEIDDSLNRKEAPFIRQRIQTELTYLLAQQFIDGTSLLEQLAKKEKTTQDGCQIFYIAAMLESTNKTITPETSEFLFPSQIRQHKLYVKNQSGQELGYLSFPDDRLYYIVVPLFEQKKVRIKIQTTERQPNKGRKTTAKYQNLHLWIKLCSENIPQMPENLNLQIEQLLLQYKQ